MNLLTTFALAALLTPQTPDPSQTLPGPRPAFDVASIRPANSGPFFTLKTNPGRLAATGASLGDLIQAAYGVSALQTTGVPDMGRFDIEAKAEGTHTRKELLEMLKTLIADRFKLELHTGDREMPVQALAMGKKPWKGTPAAADGDPSIGLRGNRGDGKVRSVFMTGKSVSLPFLGNYLTGRFQRIFIDRTGLAGAFDFEVEVLVDSERAADRNVPEREVANEIITDFVANLGLKMEPQRAMVPILVVDRAERPDEN
jgi:uncharacterized protein (TIGR03435 family)